MEIPVDHLGFILPTSEWRMCEELHTIVLCRESRDDLTRIRNEISHIV
jgi:hypothetical protein